MKREQDQEEVVGGERGGEGLSGSGSGSGDGGEEEIRSTMKKVEKKKATLEEERKNNPHKYPPLVVSELHGKKDLEYAYDLLEEVLTPEEMRMHLSDWWKKGMAKCKPHYDELVHDYSELFNSGSNNIFKIVWTFGKHYYKWRKCERECLSQDSATKELLRVIKDLEPIERENQKKLEEDFIYFDNRYPIQETIRLPLGEVLTQGIIRTMKGPDTPHHPYNQWNETGSYILRGNLPPDYEPKQPGPDYVWWWSMPDKPSVFKSAEEWEEEVKKRPQDFQLPEFFGTKRKPPREPHLKAKHTPKPPPRTNYPFRRVSQPFRRVSQPLQRVGVRGKRNNRKVTALEVDTIPMTKDNHVAWTNAERLYFYRMKKKQEEEKKMKEEKGWF